MKEDILGKVFENRLGQKYIALSWEYVKKTEYYYKVRFLETGSEKVVEKRNLKRGNVRDDYAKTIYGVACRGNANSRHPLFNKKAFKRWYAMIERCYSEKAAGYMSYGNKGATVCDRWLCFENYLKDIKNIPGFNEKQYINGEIQLDKDLKIEGNRIYSPDTCIFVGMRKNKTNQPGKIKEFKAIDPDGNVYIFNNQNECARQFSLTARTIGKVLAGQLKTHKGWRFKYTSDTK